MIRDGQCPEFNVEEQAICAVGLAKSKPGIFIEAIQYVLILATPIEVQLTHSVPVSLGMNAEVYIYFFCLLLLSVDLLLNSKCEYVRVLVATDACC